MAGTSVSMVRAPTLSIAAVITTLGRPTLQRALDSMENQTLKPKQTIIKDGPGDTISKMTEALKEVECDLVAWIDDDAVYPDTWAENAVIAFKDPKVAYVSGTYMPLSELDGNATDAEQCIAEVSNSWFGSMNMSQRRRKQNKTKDGDDMNLAGSGMYRASVLKEIFQEADKIPPAASETYIIHKMRKMGFRTLYVPGASFYHKQKSNVFAFARQTFRSGTGRAAYFRQFPSEIPQRALMFVPSLFLIYLIAFFGVNLFTPWSLTGVPLVLYVAFILVVSYGFNKHKSRFLPLYYVVHHLSYGAGMIVGFFKEKRTWT